MARNKKLTIFVMCIGIFLCMLDTTIMNIALPAIQTGLKVSLENLSWAMNVYTIVFAVFTVPLGRLADRYGRNKIYLAGLLIFAAGSIGSGLADSSAALIAGRSIQSLGAAIVFPASMTIGISQVAIENRTKVIACLGVTQGLAAALGPVIGGMVTQYMGWRWVFLINVPLLAIALVICVLQFDWKHEQKSREKIDVSGSLLSMIFLFALTLALVKGREWGWAAPRMIGLLLLSAASFVLFILYERRAQSPMIPMKLFKNRNFNGAALTVVLSQLFLVGVMVILPTFLTHMQHVTELTAALYVTPVSLAIFIFSPIAGFLIKKLGARLIIFCGFLAMAVAYYSYYHLNITQNNLQLIFTCVLMGSGYGLIVGPITVLAAADFKGELLTASQSVVGVLRQLGAVLAVAVFISGLTSNVSMAGVTSIHAAKKQIQTLEIPKKDQQAMLQQISAAIKHQKAEKEKPAISKTKEKSILSATYQKTLAQNHLKGQNVPERMKKTIHAKVTRSVKQKVHRLNDQVAHSEKQISHEINLNMTNAFSSLYGWACPFVLAACFIAFLFKKKQEV
ncbi:MAG: MFS transporter [Sporolactobacillus sp.]